MIASLENFREATQRALRTRARMEKASDARRALPPGSSRARVTTANARWSTACEDYERAREALLDLCRAALEQDIPFHRLDA